MFDAPVEDGGLPRSSALFHVMEEYKKMVEHARLTDPCTGCLPNAVAYLTVTQLQANLKGVTLRLVWDSPSGGAPLENVQLVPVHRDGYASGEGE